MKKSVFVLIMASTCIFCFAQTQKVYCKCCGLSFNSVAVMSNSTCFKSASQKHQVYEGFEKKTFYCLWCGNAYNSLKYMANSTCYKNPNDQNHSPYEGAPKSKYQCQYCGNSYNSLKTMANSPCHKSTNKKHFPMR